MIKLKDKNAEVQFVYEEDVSKASHGVQEEVITDDELSGLEFAAATIVSNNPLLGTEQENHEINREQSEAITYEQQLELSEEAKGQRTATVVHINRQKIESNQVDSGTNPALSQKPIQQIDSSKEHKVSADQTRDSIRPQSLEKVSTVKMANPVQRQVEPTPIKRREPLAPIEDENILERIHQIETHAEVRVALAEFKAEFLAEHLGEAKALEYQVKQLLKPLVKTNNEAMIKQVQKIFSLLEGHSKGTIELVKSKAQAEKIVKPTQDKANRILQQNGQIKKAS